MNLDIRRGNVMKLEGKKPTDTELFGTRLGNVISTDASLVTSGKTDQSPNTDSKWKLSTTRKSASRET